LRFDVEGVFAVVIGIILLSVWTFYLFAKLDFIEVSPSLIPYVLIVLFSMLAIREQRRLRKISYFIVLAISLAVNIVFFIYYFRGLSAIAIPMTVAGFALFFIWSK